MATRYGAMEQPELAAGEERASFGDRFKGFLPRLPLHAVLIAVIIIWSVPTIALLISSFRSPQDIASDGWWNALIPPWDFTWSNYDAVLNQRGMGRAFVNSLLITVPVTILVLLIAAAAAYAIAWMEFPLRNGLFLVMVAMLVVPLQMTLIPVLRLYVNLSIDTEVPIIGGRVFGPNSYLGIWLAHTAYGLPFAIFLLRNFFGSLPRDLFESAYLDGASDLRVFFRIVLPLSMPALASLAIFQFLWTWNDLLVALVFAGSDHAPITVAIREQTRQFGANVDVISAGAFVSLAIPLIVFFAFQRYFVQGILAGSAK